MRSWCPLSRLLMSALSVVLLFVGPAGAIEPEPGASERLAESTYVDRSGRVTMVVDSYVASLRDSDPYVPIRIAIGVNGAGKPIRLGLESFTLIDEKGNEISPAPFETVQSSYGKRSADEALFQQRPILLDDRFDPLKRIESQFYPAPDGRATRSTRVELSPQTWFQDVLYFQRPSAGVAGVLTLRVTAPALDRPLKVRFYVVHPGAEKK